jgi:predicted TIM-barrel fold metal-dependent hydrolase
MNAAYRIDTHHHVIPERYRQQLKLMGSGGSGERGLPAWSPDRSFEMMEENGIQFAVVSIGSPGIYFGDVDSARNLARVCNDELAALCSTYPMCFAGLASLPLPDISATLREIEYALDSLNLDGVSTFSHVGQFYLGHRDFAEVYAELDRRAAAVFVHPLRPLWVGSELAPRYSYAAGYAELVFDSTRAIFNLFHNGVFKNYPNIKFIFPHLGGTAPYLQYRMQEIEELPAVQSVSSMSVEEAMRHVYFDLALSAKPIPMRAALEFADHSRLLFGTDFPFAINTKKAISDTVRGVGEFDGFDADLRRAIERENAMSLFPRIQGLGL